MCTSAAFSPGPTRELEEKKSASKSSSVKVQVNISTAKTLESYADPSLDSYFIFLSCVTKHIPSYPQSCLPASQLSYIRNRSSISYNRKKTCSGEHQNPHDFLKLFPAPSESQATGSPKGSSTGTALKTPHCFSTSAQRDWEEFHFSGEVDPF